MKTIKLATIALVALATLAAPALARSLEELQQRFKERYPAIVLLKRDGKVGETYLGYIEVRTSVAADQQRLVSDENADRRDLYQQLAQKENTTPEKVAERNAIRNFQKAPPGEWLKGPNGWAQKAAR